MWFHRPSSSIYILKQFFRGHRNGRLEPSFIRNLQGLGEQTQVGSNGPVHMVNIAAMTIYDKKKQT